MVVDKISFNLRITEQLNQDLMKIAEEERRSKNAQIEYILEEYVKNYKNEKGDHTEINQNGNINNANINIKK